MDLFRRDRKAWVMVTVGVGIYMSTLDASIVNITLPTIVRALNTTVSAVAWVVTAYLIVITGCLLLMGGLADLVGQRRIYLWGLSVFTLGSCLCGLSPSIYFLIGSRMIQGLGAASLMANGTAIVSTVFPEKDRGQALGFLGSIVSAGFLTGPILGGLIVEHLGWRWVFYINLPIGIFGILLSLKILSAEESRRKAKPDLWGAAFLFIFLTSVLFFINHIADRITPFHWACLTLSAISFTLFVRAELSAPFPLVDLKLLGRRLFLASLGASLLSFCMSGAHSFVMPFFLQDILGYSPSKVGMLVFPISLTVLVMAPIGGRISDRIGVRMPATSGLLLMSAVIFSFIFLRVGTADYAILARHVALGIGISLFNPANNSAIIGSLPRKRVGMASSFLALARNLGMVIGVASAEAVMAFGSGPLEKGLPRGGPTLAGIHEVWKLTLGIGLIAAFLSWSRKQKIPSEETSQGSDR